MLGPVQDLFLRSAAPPTAGQTAAAPHRTLSVRFLRLSGLPTSQEIQPTTQKKTLEQALRISEDALANPL